MPYQLLTTMRAPFGPTPSSTRGFSLIEALVTLVIIGLGVLAAASLQIGARKGQQEAAQRTTASAAVQNLTERMQGNPAGRATYLKVLGANPSAASGSGIDAGPDCQSATSLCSPEDLAKSDLGRWWAALTGTGVTSGTNAEATPALDRPTVCLCLRPATTNDFRLVLAWRGAGPAGGFADEVGAKAGLTCGDTETALYDDPDTGALDVAYRRTETVRFVFPEFTSTTALPSVPACAA